MSRSVAMLPISVLKSRIYKQLSLGARDLYIDINASVNGVGFLYDPWSIARGRGWSDDELDELVDFGLIIIAGDECFVTHFWLANKYQKWCVNTLSQSDAIREGIVGFDGDPFKSRFVLIDDNLQVTCKLLEGTGEATCEVLVVNSTQFKTSASTKQPSYDADQPRVKHDANENVTTYNYADYDGQTYDDIPF